MSTNISTLKLGDKVKLKLEQPAIMCSGRIAVSCWYRGKVKACQVHLGIRLMDIEFRSHGELQSVSFVDDKCTDDDWQDLKIV